ncbi:MAG: M28 family peptidase [Holophagaceae bacterium]|nr:M28 family peptidase [Holophagaceae bacterium]
MRQLICLFFAITLIAQSSVEQRFTMDINYLVSQKLEGRENGSKGLQKAADFIQKRYKNLGLNVDRQTYPFVNNIKRASASCSLAGKTLAFGKDVEMLGSSGDGNFKKAPILFAGYGLTTTAWNDFGGIDPKGTVVAISRKIPDINAIREIARSDLELHTRIRRIANLGAIGIIVLEEKQTPESLKRLEGPLTHPVPVLSLPMNKLDGQWGTTKELVESVTEGPATKFLAGMTMDLSIRTRRVTVKLPNVIGILQGSDPDLSKEYIVLGAHMDHLGMGERNSRGSAGQLHPGADDNASGTAMLMELARQLRIAPPKRSVLFVHFSGEEDGLLGSAHWIQYPTVPIPRIKFMVNFDMVGRLDNTNPTLHVGGLGATSATLEQYHSLAPEGIAIGGDLGLAMGGSDHMSFATARIPSFFFFTGIHTDYHTPRDTIDRLNIPGMARIADYAKKVVQGLANAQELPLFDTSTAQLDTRQVSTSIRRISFGTVPDFSGGSGGFRISGTTPGSTAEGIGLKAGDQIISFGGMAITDIYDFMEALGTFKGGDKVIVKWIRDGQELQAEAILRER